MSALATARVALAYLWRHRRWPALSSPQRFTEWVQWRKLNDRDRDRARLTDKALSKQLAAQALGDEFIIPTLWEGQVLPADPPWPMPFMVKANHGCGHYVVVRDAADYARARRDAPAWLERAYGGWLDEWHYRAARRSILVEPYIGAGDVLPLDYKIYVFGGRAAMVQLHEGRAAAHRWHQYDRQWQPLSRHAGAAPPPVSLEAMLAAAETLGAGHDFVRVDFYELGGRPVFSEFCLFPGSGLDPFDPVGLDQWLGTLWTAQRGTRPAQADQWNVPGVAETLRTC
ncbi:MAG: hypothetical protein LH465_08155 [Sphingomonas bacterium]|nr:hypothetical protein [Sphingomonas bacterium]